MSQQRLCNSPTLSNLTHDILRRHTDVVKLNLIKVVLVIDADNRINLDAFGLHVHQDEGNTLLLLAAVVGPNETENPVRMLSIGGPNLGAVNNKVITVALCFCLQARQVRTGTRL